MGKAETIVSWICRIPAAVILLQTLYFKFTGAEGRYEARFVQNDVELNPVLKLRHDIFNLELDSRIYSITEKCFPTVAGDGESALEN